MPSGQRVRTPTEVIEHHRGTCHDLAILFASCLEHVRINPLIVLMRGHTYVGFWTSLQAWTEFWRRSRSDKLRLPQVPGRNWIINSAEEFKGLVQNGDILLLEATLVADRNATFDAALKQGHSKLFPNSRFDVAVDVVAARQRIQPL